MNFNSKTIKINGDSFTLTELSARQRKDLFKLFNDQTDPIEVQAHTILMGCKEFKGKEIDDILDCPGTVVSALSDGVMEISGLSDSSQKDAVKNS
jgi:hypothetical protein